MDYHLAKFQFGRLSLASFMDRFKKHNDDIQPSAFRVKMQHA